MLDFTRLIWTQVEVVVEVGVELSKSCMIKMVCMMYCITAASDQSPGIINERSEMLMKINGTDLDTLKHCNIFSKVFSTI